MAWNACLFCVDAVAEKRGAHLGGGARQVKRVPLTAERVKPAQSRSFGAVLLEDSSNSAMTGRVDRTDLKILAILQEDASLPVAEVAARVNLSQTPCWRRIQRLEAQGVIERRVALLDPEAVGLGLSVFVEIEAADHARTGSTASPPRSRRMPEVMEVYRHGRRRRLPAARRGRLDGRL